jgi:carboxymethylenebutenolidase
MIRRLFLAALFLTTACATTSTPPIAPQGTTPQANAQLETTPRHDEWVALDSGGRKLHAYVVYPQSSRKAGAVVVIHENRGLTDWVRTVADKLAENGYLAIAPDFLSGTGPNGGRTSDFPTQDAAREGISKLSRDQVMADLDVAANYIRTLPSANGKLAVAGFCWGGSRTFDYANRGERIAASFVFYGSGPSTDEGVTGIDGPVYGFYGGDDARVNATIEPTKALMDKHGKKFDPVIYAGAGHAFMRLGEDAAGTEANKKAREEAWARWLGILKTLQ